MMELQWNPNRHLKRKTKVSVNQSSLMESDKPWGGGWWATNVARSRSELFRKILPQGDKAIVPWILHPKIASTSRLPNVLPKFPWVFFGMPSLAIYRHRSIQWCCSYQTASFPYQDPYANHHVWWLDIPISDASIMFNCSTICFFLAVTSDFVHNSAYTMKKSMFQCNKDSNLNLESWPRSSRRGCFMGKWALPGPVWQIAGVDLPEGRAVDTPATPAMEDPAMGDFLGVSCRVIDVGIAMSLAPPIKLMVGIPPIKMVNGGWFIIAIPTLSNFFSDFRSSNIQLFLGIRRFCWETPYFWWFSIQKWSLAAWPCAIAGDKQSKYWTIGNHSILQLMSVSTAGKLQEEPTSDTKRY